MLDYRTDLNEDQYGIVTAADGHCLVLAGAGSGKTRTLTYRVVYLLENGVRPEEILLMTFTNKAAQEMVGRVRDLLGYEPYALKAGTFHRIGNLVLRHYGHLLGYDRNFAILDQSDSKDIFKLCCKELQIDTKGGNFPKIEVIQSIISYSRNTGQDLDSWLCVRYNFPSFILDKIKSIASSYEKRKKSLNVLDFDDLLVKWHYLLRDFPEIKKELAGKFRYVLVDEYQDTNTIQAMIIKDLASVHKNVLAVGDDSQSIYSFRAADIGHILNFEKNFDGTKIFKLLTNYRSTPEILELANQSIAYNSNQYFKELRSIKSSGVKPRVIGARNVYDQADRILERIRERSDAGGRLSDMAILFRAGHMSAELQLLLTKNGIPFVVRSGQKYFDQAHIKDIISILRIWANIHDELSWRRFLTLLPGIGIKSVEKMYQTILTKNSLREVVDMNYPFTSRQKEGWAQVRLLLERLCEFTSEDKYDIAEGIRYIFTSFYKKYLKNTYDDADSRSDDIAAFVSFTSKYTSLDELLADITLDDSVTQQASGRAEDQDVLVLSTIHQAKGLEWDEIFVIGLREGAFPHFRSRESLSELEEERRLFYVAVTRARNHLTLIYPIRVQSYEYGEIISDPSLFIQELDPDCYDRDSKVFSSQNSFNEDGYNKKNLVYGSSSEKSRRSSTGGLLGDYGLKKNSSSEEKEVIDPEYEEEYIKYDDFS